MDIKLIFGCLNKLKSLNSYNFNGITQVQIVNLIFLSKDSFDIIFKDFKSYIESLRCELR